MVVIVASRRQRAHCFTRVSAQGPDQMRRPKVGRKMVGGMLIGALSISALVTGTTVTLAQSSAMSRAKPAAKAGVGQGIPLPPTPPGLRAVSVTIPLPSVELVKPQGEPDCEIPASDRLLGAIPETTRLIYERQCYKNAETLVREKLQLLQDAIAGTVKALNDTAGIRTLQPPEGAEQGASAVATDVAIPPKAGASAESSEAPGNAGDRRDAKSALPGDQGVQPPDQHREPTPSSGLSVNLASQEDDVAKSSSPDAAVSKQALHEKTRGTQTPNTETPNKETPNTETPNAQTPNAQSPNMPARNKPVIASAKALACQTSRPPGPGPRSWRTIDGRKCWYEGAAGMDKSLLHWPPIVSPLGFLLSAPSRKPQ